MTQDEYLKWLETEGGFSDIKLLPDGQWAAIYQFMFTHAICIGTPGDYAGYNNRWCYHSHNAAKTALAKWDGNGEPEGWHRHPITGRRKDENGDEYINP